MLVELSAENFRGIKTRQSLSLVPGKGSGRDLAHSIQTGRDDIPYVLKAVAIFGANGSGKSTLLSILGTLREFVRSSAVERKPNQSTFWDPFRFAKATRAAPTSLEVTFLVGDTRYKYACAVQEKHVVKEWLEQSLNGKKPTVLIDRTLREGTDQYIWNNNLPGLTHAQCSIIEEFTRPNALFLSTAVQLNADVLRDVYEWFVRDAAGDLRRQARYADITRHLLVNDEERYRKKVLDFLNASDLRIVDVRAEKFKYKNVNNEDVETIYVSMGHTDDTGEIQYLHEYNESEGTRRLFGLAGTFISAWASGDLLLVDELDKSVHPLAAMQLVHLFCEDEWNKGSQLILTSHNPALLREDVLHRDQIWFTERNPDQSIQLKALSEFESRNDTAVEDRYLSGRYGGIPLIRSKLRGEPPETATDA